MSALPALAPTTGSLAAVAGLLAGRQFERLAGLFDPNIDFRALTPDGLREATTAEAAIAWFVDWFGGGHDQEVVLSEPFTVGSRTGLRFRLRRKLGRDHASATWHLIEQHWFADAGPNGIERLSLVCSGNTPDPAAPVDGAVHEFDAGDLGCADGLPQEFLGRIRAIPVGDALRVITSDPSARQDLPSLARMNGHEVAEPRALSDGTTLFVITRRR